MERTAAGNTTRFLYDGETIVAELSGANAVTLYRTPGVGYVRSGSQRYEQDSALGSLLTARDASGGVVGQTEYDAYGREVWTGATGDRGDFRFAGSKGYANDDATGMQMLGARYYLPVLGRFLTQDPIGHEGGLNLYAYCADSPLGRVDPNGLDPNLLQQFGQAASFLWSGWSSALRSTADFFDGSGSRDRAYGPNSVESRQMEMSLTGGAIEDAVANSGWLRNGPINKAQSALGMEGLGKMAGHLGPLFRTLAEPENGTQAQVGGFIWSAHRKGNQVHVEIYNEITFKSLAYDYFGRSGLKASPNGNVPFGRVRQRYDYWIGVPRGK